MTDFAKYAFNKSHAAAYAVVAYRTAYLKYYYPCEFMAALLTSVLDNSDKVANYIDDCKKNGIEILPPNVNLTYKNFTVAPNGKKAIMFGLLAIKNLGHDFIDTIISERERNGEFKSFYSFCKRVHGKGFNRRAVESLIKSGALDGLGSNRQEMLVNLSYVIDDLDSTKRRNLDGQIGFFDLLNSDTTTEFKMKPFAEFPVETLLMYEKETTGLYISSHPMERYAHLKKKLKCDKISELTREVDELSCEYSDASSVKVMGIISTVTKKQTKNGDTMAFITVEDTDGSVEVIIFPKLFSKYANIIYNGNILMIGGRLSVKEEERAKIILDFAESAESIESNQVKKVGLFIRAENETSEIYKKCNNLLSTAKHGDMPVYFYFSSSKKYFPCKKIEVTDVILNELKGIAGVQNVILQK